MSRMGSTMGSRMGSRATSMDRLTVQERQFVDHAIDQLPADWYGPTPLTQLNYTKAGPGHWYIKWAWISGVLAFIFMFTGLLYVGLRASGRVSFIVYRLEVIGPIIICIACLLVWATIHLIIRGREESNAWREQIRFRGYGLSGVKVINMMYDNGDLSKLATGTVTATAIKEITAPVQPKKKKRRRARSKASLAKSQQSLASGYSIDGEMPPPPTREELGLQGAESGYPPQGQYGPRETQGAYFPPDSKTDRYRLPP
ncbi:unnamed protein product [Owenia fusiformis]|uniref:Uncharacterized protein n=1 Tax=Owenia fusiformis TaxID=6347 RepID=A0A8S4PQW9_OWEFU|nr:unnamed protein product [Owenia fusiformis]